MRAWSHSLRSPARLSAQTLGLRPLPLSTPSSAPSSTMSPTTPVLKRLRPFLPRVGGRLAPRAGRRAAESSWAFICYDHLRKVRNGSVEALRYLLAAPATGRAPGVRPRRSHWALPARWRCWRRRATTTTTRTCMRLGITHQNASDFASARLAFDLWLRLGQARKRCVAGRSIAACASRIRVPWSDPQTLDPNLHGNIHPNT